MSALQQLDTLIAELELQVGSRAVKSANAVPSSSSAAKKSSSAPAPATASTETVEELTVNSLDLRVGVIRTCVRHESAEKLYCETIDVGETNPRNIASGLVPYYSLEQMVGRKVIVICNLPPRKLVGFKSEVMVLCASSDEGVEFVDVPDSAEPGDRITGEGMTSPALSQKQCDKRKAFEKVAEGLIVNNDGVATWNGVKMEVHGKGVCTSPKLRNVLIR